MANTILIKRSGTPGSIPAAGNVSLGELAINYADGNLFYKDGGGTIKVIASNQTFTLSGNIAAGNVTTAGIVSAGGNVQGGNLTTVGLVSASGNVIGDYFIGNGRFLSGIDTTLISNGNSSVQTLANANITVNPGGTANVVVFDPAGGTVTGYWSVSGNLTSANVSTGIVTASGNITGANVLTAGLISAGGNITGANVSTGIVTASGNITGANVLTAGLISAGGNLTSANVNTGIVTASGNITGANVTTAGTANIGTLEVTSSGQFGTTLSVTGTATLGNVSTAGYLSATGNLTSGNVTTAGTANIGTLEVTGTTDFTGNVSGGNISLSGNIAANGVLTDNYYYANGAPVDFQQAAGSNTQLQFNNNNDFGASANLTFDSATSALNVTGTTTVTGNVLGGNILANTALRWQSGNSSITNDGSIVLTPDTSASANNGVKIGGNGYLLAPNGARNAQLNYNSQSGQFGTYQLAVYGNTAQAIYNGGANTIGDIGNSTGYFGNIYAKGVQTTFVSASGNVTSGNVNTGIVSASGNLTSANISTGIVSASGNVTGANFDTAGLITASGNITGANVLTSGLISAGGNLTSANVNTGIVTASGNITGANFDTAGLVTAGGNITGANVLTSGLISAGGNLTSANVNTGIVSASGNITGANIITVGLADVGSLEVTNGANVGTNLSVVGNISGGNISTTGIISAGGNITGANLFFGSGNVSGTGNVNSGNVNTGIVSASGNITGINLLTTGIVSATSNVIAGNITTAGIANIGTLEVTGNGTVSGYLSVTGNVTGGNLITSGALSTSGNIGANNITITNTATATTLSATGSLIAANASVSGTLTVAGNIQSNSTIIANTFSSVSDGMTLQPASGNINLFTTSTGNVVLQNNYINNLASPVQSTDAVTKQYVDDAVSSGITIHTPVYVESPNTDGSLNATYAQGGTTHTVTDITNTKTLTFSANHGLSVNDQIYWSSAFNGILANTAYFVYSTPALDEVTLSTAYSGVELTGLTNGTGLTETGRANSGQGATLTNAGANVALTIDGVTLSATQRVLIYSQTNAYENGVYVVTDAGAPDSPGPGSAWVLTRASDADTYIPDSTFGMDAGDYFFVESGDTGAGESYVLTSPTGTIIIGYSALTYTQFSSSQVYSANTSAGLTLTGTVFSAKVDNDTTAFSGGNIVVKASANLTTPNIGAATGNSLSLTGNLVAANISAGTGVITTTGNITGGNVLFGTGVVSGTGNIFATNVDATGLANIANLTVYTFANITSSTAATDTTSGALRVAGGVGVVGNIYAGAMYVGTDSVLTINSTVDGGTY